MNEYKGIYYKDETEQKYYEGGAHFQYIKLYKVLEKIAEERHKKEQEKKILHVNKSKNIGKITSNNNHKKTRNIINHLNEIKLEFNTISNNSNKRNHILNNKVLLSSNNNNKTKSRSQSKKSNFSLINNKKEIDSRNRQYNKDIRGKPNTIIKYRFNKKNNRVLSSSIEQKNRSKIKIKCPINFKRSLPEFSSIKSKKIKNYSINKNHVLNSDIRIKIKNINIKNIIKDYKSENISIISNNKKNNIHKNDSINIQTYFNRKLEDNHNENLLNNNKLKNELQTKIFGAPDNNINAKKSKSKELKLSEKENNEKKIIENYSEAKEIKKKSDNFCDKMKYSNTIDLSNKAHNITVKKIKKKNNDKNRTESLITSDIHNNGSEIFNKLNIDKGKINVLVNKSSQKKNIKSNIKKDFNIHNNTFIKQNNFNEHFFRLFKDSNKNKVEKKYFMNKNSTNKKKRNIILKMNNNHKLVLQDKNTSIKRNIKNTNNNNYKKDKLKDFYTINDINKTYSNGIISKINLNKSRNISRNKNNSNLNNYKNKEYNSNYIRNNRINENGSDELSKKKCVIKPYILIKPNEYFTINN